MIARPADPAAAINDLFRATYARLADLTIAEIDPLLIVHSTPTGGRYIVTVDGVREEAEPVPPTFAYLKSIAHAPTLLGALSSPAGRMIDDRAAIASALRAACEDALTALDDHTDLTPLAREAAQDALTGTVAALDAQVDAGVVDDRVRKACERLILEVGRIQAEACHALLLRWRTAMGDAAWSRLYAIVGTGWGMREHGTHYEILRATLGDERIGVRLFAAMGARDEAALRHRLGLILANRATSKAVLGDGSRMDVELIGDAVVRALREAADRAD